VSPYLQHAHHFGAQLTKNPALCFHILTNSFFRNSPVLTFIQTAPGVGQLIQHFSPATFSLQRQHGSELEAAAARAESASTSRKEAEKKVDEKLKAIGQAPINAMWPSETTDSGVFRRA
jgi:hypothetical protein